MGKDNILSNQTELEKNKEYYEIKKLKAEIDLIQRPGYKKLSFWQFIATSSVGLCTVILLYVNGVFDLERKSLETKKKYYN